MFRFAGAVAVMFSVTPLATHAQSAPKAAPPTALKLHERAEAALSEVRETLDGGLTDYPSARFRNVHARLVRSVYSNDDGQFDKVPWIHRGEVMLVLCGEINAKNRMGGYTGWEPFGLQPSQTEFVTFYIYGKPPIPKTENIAAKPKLMLRGNSYDEHLSLMCGGAAEAIDPADLTEHVSYKR